MAEHRGSLARVQCKVNWDVRSRWIANFVANLGNFLLFDRVRKREDRKIKCDMANI
jgi:hypothetical protein